MRDSLFPSRITRRFGCPRLQDTGEVDEFLHFLRRKLGADIRQFFGSGHDFTIAFRRRENKELLRDFGGLAPSHRRTYLFGLDNEAKV